MVTLVEQMLELHKRLAAASQADRELYQRQIDATDREIDRLSRSDFTVVTDRPA
jgi:hypothetical protein